MKNNCKFFSNKSCEYYPCHKTKGKDINCLFCFCPLYPLGTECGGNFKILANGTKDCSECTFVHDENAYEYIMKKLSEMY